MRDTLGDPVPTKIPFPAIAEEESTAAGIQGEGGAGRALNGTAAAERSAIQFVPIPTKLPSDTAQAVT